METEHIQVAARVRPPLQTGQRCVSADTAIGRITIRSTNNKQADFDFTAVFDENSSQELVYTETAKHVVDGFVTGMNGTVFAYGQTGSGKTHTMIGPDLEKPSPQRGVMPRAIRSVFNYLDEQTAKLGNNFVFVTRVSFLELYNERIYDLLQNSQPIEYREIESREVDVQNSEECLELIRKGWSSRKTAPTAMNHESSRSHAIVTLLLLTKYDEGGVVQKRSSRLHLVDLAGSERQSETQAAGDRLREACNINKSLSTLCQVIRLLSSARPPSYINFRDSLLTRILQDALGGNSRTSVIVNLHSMAAYYNDSLSTLRFATNVRKIKNTAKVNENVSGASADILQAKIVELNLKLRAAEEACKQAESQAKAARTSVEGNMDDTERMKGEREKFEAMKAEFSSMLHEMKLKLAQAELSVRMLQNSNKFLVDSKKEFLPTEEITELLNERFDEAIEQWKKTIAEESVSTVSDLELRRYRDEALQLRRELAQKTEQFEQKNMEFEELTATVLNLKQETAAPLSPEPNRNRRRHDSRDNELRAKNNELKLEIVQLNQVINERERIIADMHSTGNSELQKVCNELAQAHVDNEELQNTLKARDEALQTLEDEVKRLRERITRSDDRVAQLDSEKCAVEKQCENFERELAETKDLYEQLLANTSISAKCLPDIENTENIAPAVSEIERQLCDARIALDERDDTINALRAAIQEKDESLKTYRKLRTRSVSVDNRCHKCDVKNQQLDELNEKYEAVVNAMSALEDELNNNRRDYENNLSLAKDNIADLENRLKKAMKDYDKVSQELRIVISVVLESTLNPTETRFSVFGPGGLSTSQSDFEMVCERLRQQQRALLDFDLTRQGLENENDRAMQALEEAKTELNETKKLNDDLQALVAEKTKSITTLQQTLDETHGLKDNKARLAIFTKIKNEKYEVEKELYDFRRRCKCGANR